MHIIILRRNQRMAVYFIKLQLASYVSPSYNIIFCYGQSLLPTKKSSIRPNRRIVMKHSSRLPQNIFPSGSLNSWLQKTNVITAQMKRMTTKRIATHNNDLTAYIKIHYYNDGWFIYPGDIITSNYCMGIKVKFSLSILNENRPCRTSDKGPYE